jgi:replication factor A1
VSIEKENIWDGKEIYKVTKVLLKNGLLEEELLEDSTDVVNPASIVSGDQVISSEINSLVVFIL